MTANIGNNGIPYGVVNGNTVPYLLDDIQSSGDNLTYAEFKADLEASISDALVGVVEQHCGNAAEIVERMDCEQLAESMLDAGLTPEFEECEYSYESNGVKYLQGWLGGAPLVWIIESPYVAYAPSCSPCVPNAGDLDNMGGGILCYCCPPDDFNSDDESADEYRVTGEIERGGKMYKIIAKTAKVAE